MSSTRELKLFQSWQDNPEKFVRECIGAVPSNQQVEGLRYVKDIANAKLKKAEGQSLTPYESELASKIGITVKSGRGTGKDCWLSWVYLWLLTCFWKPQGLVTAPTSHQLRDVLWKEIARWLLGNKTLSEALVWQTEKVFNKDFPETWFITARTANIKATPEEQAETLSGLHGRYMILSADEASGLPYGIFTNLEMTLTDAMNFVILISNPTRGNGYFYDTHNKDKDYWVCLTWNAEDSDRIDFNKGYIETQIRKYGRDSNMFRINVLGEFPSSDTSSLIPYTWIRNAVDRELLLLDRTYTLKGIDVGGGVDKTVIVTRKGNIVTGIEEFSSANTMEIVGWIAERLSDESYDVAFIDPIGIGAGVYDRLTELRVENLIPVDVRAESSDPSCFRLRDSLFWTVRTVFEKGTIQIPDDEELIGELSTIRHADTDKTKGLIKIESKFDMRKRGLESPNKADALALTYYFGERTYESVGKGIDNRKEERKEVSWRVG